MIQHIRGAHFLFIFHSFLIFGQSVSLSKITIFLKKILIGCARIASFGSIARYGNSAEFLHEQRHLSQVGQLQRRAAGLSLDRWVSPAARADPPCWRSFCTPPFLPRSCRRRRPSEPTHRVPQPGAQRPPLWKQTTRCCGWFPLPPMTTALTS